MIVFHRLAPDVVVSFPAREAQGANRRVRVDAEIRVMSLYSANTFLGCDCPRTVGNSKLKVWHLPDCKELDRLG